MALNPTRMAFKSLILASGLVFGGCLAQVKPLPSTMPVYDVETVNSHYSSIIEHETMYFQIMSLMSMGLVPDGKEKEAALALDRYIYWASIAKIHAFYGRWSELDEADAKSYKALNQIITLLQSNAI